MHKPNPHRPHPAEGRMLQHVEHGGHVLTDEGPEVQKLAQRDASISTLAEVLTTPLAEAAFEDDTTAFSYLFEDLAASFPAAHLPADDPAAVVAALKSLGAAMVDNPASPVDPLETNQTSTIPAVYTYFGQFIDHDLTANTDRDSAVSDITKAALAPLDPGFVADNLRNLRQPSLNLDSVYGDGPTFDPAHPTDAAALYDGIKLRLGTIAEVSNDPEKPLRGVKIPPVDDLFRDLPRDNRQPVIGDGRNDENLIIAQLHTAFLRFHNAAVDWVRAHEPQRNTDAKVFRRARQLTRWHYQWLVAHDYLKTVTLPGSTDKVLLAGNQHFLPWEAEEIFMPLEFSVAAFRFGHSMVRGAYDFNRNFGRPGNALPTAPFGLLFTFTGNGFPKPFAGDTDVLPFNWVIEWDRFVHKGSAFGDHFARRIDTCLTPPLRNLSKEGNTAPDNVIKSILKTLATRNLLRGYLLAIPTGQAVATALGATPLTAQEVQQGNNSVVNDALAAGGFLTKTPLWYYILKEAEVQAAGNSLGEVGSRIVNETILGQLHADPASYLNSPGGWDPSKGVTLPNGDPVVTIADFLAVAGVL
ncbi:MAG: heme peroxidase family protein [Propionibacteriaceae bacterium]